MHHSSSSPAAPSDARPEDHRGLPQHDPAGHPGDKGVPHQNNPRRCDYCTGALAPGEYRLHPICAEEVSEEPLFPAAVTSCPDRRAGTCPACDPVEPDTTLASLRQLAAAARIAGEPAPVPPEILDQLITVALWPNVVGHDIPVGDRDITEGRS